MPADPLPKVSGDETPAKIELAVGIPGTGVTYMDPPYGEPSPRVNSDMGPHLGCLWSQCHRHISQPWGRIEKPSCTQAIPPSTGGL
ncbi:hypothetical protein Hamer_G024903 [Homarus americanus]|uniref:Uncharacterized protein n=1 Tax=Homarus americanus TaxID=6706 RepID=A0A8J5KEM5_HOMAM|nr:hypothetical protein Hamer_G024903 [Homarus americanus]